MPDRSARTGTIRVTPSLMRRVLEEFPDAAASIHEAMAEELTRLTDDLERVCQHLQLEAFGSMDPARPGDAGSAGQPSSRPCKDALLSDRTARQRVFPLVRGHGKRYEIS
jgi:hypothetical protein